MTASLQETASPPDIYSILKGITEPHNLAIAELLAKFSSAEKEMLNADENRQRFEKAAEASKALAEAVNNEIREELRSGEVGAKAAYKKRAERAGHLEDVEIYSSMVKEAEVSRKSSELEASKVATEISYLESEVRQKADAALTDYLVAHIIEYQPLTLLVAFASDLANRGDSQLYGARPDLHSGIDFALDRVKKIMYSAFKNGVPEESGTESLLHPIPSEIKKKALSPLQIKRMDADIAAAAEVL